MPPDRPTPATAADPDEPEDRLALPQFASPQDAVITSVNWFIEPCWKGVRVLARVEGGRATLSDERGEPVEDLEEAAEVITASIDAEQAVVDGAWTAMPFVGEGSAARRWAETLAEAAEDRGEAAEDEPPIDPVALEKRRAFVAWDLLELDGQPLYDIPYQERRRLLESVVVEDIRVRITPAVRYPFRRWVAAWHANGFTHYVAKEANSRYASGEENDDWLQISAEPERGPSIIGRLFGQRPKKTPFIHD
jgi:bifunctional non-homologous end joining protein LigD